MSPTSGKVIGYTGACAQIPGAGAACKAQKDCKASVCTAFVDPVSFGPRFVCAHGIAKDGGSCAVAACPAGQLCAAKDGKARCGLACPGGDGDCGAAGKCGSMALHGHGTADPSDDPKVPVCVSK